MNTVTPGITTRGQVNDRFKAAMIGKSQGKL
jgi:hypothetical protein